MFKHSRTRMEREKFYIVTRCLKENETLVFKMNEVLICISEYFTSVKF